MFGLTDKAAMHCSREEWAGEHFYTFILSSMKQVSC